MISQNRSALVEHAISKFNPEVFAHPVWIRFGEKELSNSLEIIDNLLNAVTRTQNDDPIGACQILLLCAVYQNYAGQSHNAWMTVQNALALARQSNLSKEVLWALWGASAICFQQRNCKQAASLLEDLQVELTERNEWVLANFVVLVKESLLRQDMDSEVECSGISQKRESADLLKLTFDWLQGWGYFDQSSKLINPVIQKSKRTQSLFSIRYWKNCWRSLVGIFKGKKIRFSRHTFGDSKALTQSDSDFSTSGLTSNLIRTTTQGQRSDYAANTINMVVQMLGPFSMTIEDTLIKLTPSRGLSVLKYMLVNHKRSIPREALMDIFWSEADPEAARNNLNVAIYTIRKELRSVTDVMVICHENGTYCLSSNLNIWLDVDEFENCIKTGRRLESNNQPTAAAAKYEIAINLYQGDFLSEDPYEEWTVHECERLRVAYLDTLDHLSYINFSQGEYGACTMLCQRILTMDNCSENAHRRLMRCYSRQGQQHLALRQYQVCVEAIRKELDVAPMLATNQLYEQIRRGQQV